MPIDQDQPSPTIDATVAAFVTRQLRGVTEAVVRFIGHDPKFEAALVDLLLALGVSVVIERLDVIVPPPNRLVGFQFRGRVAILTVTPGLPLHG